MLNALSKANVINEAENLTTLTRSLFLQQFPESDKTQ